MRAAGSASPSPTRIALLAFAAVAAAGCGDATWLIVDVALGPGVQAKEARASIVAGNGAPHEQSLRAGGLPGTIGLLLPDADASVSVTVTVTDAQGCVLTATGIGQATARMTAHLPITVAAARPLTCCDGARDGDEVDVDCGGACGPCEPGRRCTIANDCATNNCAEGLCALAADPPGWSALDALPAAVLQAGTATSAEGVVYVFGGNTDPMTPAASRDAYALLAGGGWGKAPALASRRYAHGGVAAADGAVWAVGGQSDKGALASVEVLRPGSAAWIAGPSLAVARAGLAVARAGDGRVYAAGGRAMNELDVVEAIRRGEMAWQRAAPLPAARSGLALAPDRDGRLYAIGGQLDGKDRAEVWRYDPARDAWTAVASLPSPASGIGAALAPDGRIHVAGAAGAFAYAPSVDRWVHLPSPAVPRAGAAVTLAPDGRVAIIGGLAEGGKAVASVEGYGPAIELALIGAGDAALVKLTALAPFARAAHVEVRAGDPKAAVVADGFTAANGVLAPMTFPRPKGAAADVLFYVADDRSRYPVSARLPPM